MPGPSAPAGRPQAGPRDVGAALPSSACEDHKIASPGTATGEEKSRSVVAQAKQTIYPSLMERIDIAKASNLSRPDLESQISDVVADILVEQSLQLSQCEQRDLVGALLDEVLGLGPLEVLLADESVTDIMVNGAKQVYVERQGRLELTDVTFRDDAHVMRVASRIVTAVGRRVDETTPLADARLGDGSRVNVIIPPLALRGPSISIRKFSKHHITLEMMARQGNMSPEMAKMLMIAGQCRLNILISGGTGSGKTTLLNAMSQMIDPGERIVTIEDAAELQLQQPHVVPLETRPPSIEGQGEITQRDLMRNALRMRPDRIIVGEVRGGEALDMLQAMNTGHDGSMCTVHANRPREALTRLENMVAMTGVKLPPEAVRSQIACAVNLIVQIARMRDGVRRVTHISEIVGMEGDVVTMQDLFTFEYKGENASGCVAGVFKSSGLWPRFMPKAEQFGLDRVLSELMSSTTGRN
jgi:pilus assembly protein CpaF